MGPHQGGAAEEQDGAGFQMCLEAEGTLDVEFGEERSPGASKVLAGAHGRIGDTSVRWGWGRRGMGGGSVF